MIINNLIKAGIMAGSVYYTKELGVWGSADQSEKVYYECTETMQPYIDDFKSCLPFDLPDLPESGEIRFLAKHYYNQAVKSTFRTIYKLPTYAEDLGNKTKDLVDRALTPSGSE